MRHHNAHLYAVTAKSVREDKYSTKSLRAAPEDQLAALEDLRLMLTAETELLIVFGASIKGHAVRQLVEFGNSLPFPVRYCALLDYSNSRGAIDMGLLPDLQPGYVPASGLGMTAAEMVADAGLDALWVVGANPLETTPLASTGAFVVVQDMFLTETAKRADIVFPSASAYEKAGTVTNVCGEVQLLKQAIRVMGTKPDLEIMGLLGKEMGLAPTTGPLGPGYGLPRGPRSRARLQRSAARGSHRRRRANGRAERPHLRREPSGTHSIGA